MDKKNSQAIHSIGDPSINQIREYNNRSDDFEKVLASTRERRVWNLISQSIPEPLCFFS
jgi:hypothetical protein